MQRAQKKALWGGGPWNEVESRGVWGEGEKGTLSGGKLGGCTAEEEQPKCSTIKGSQKNGMETGVGSFGQRIRKLLVKKTGGKKDERPRFSVGGNQKEKKKVKDSTKKQKNGKQVHTGAKCSNGKIIVSQCGENQEKKRTGSPGSRRGYGLSPGNGAPKCPRH